VRGFDLVPTPDLADCVVADLADGDAVMQAAEGVDAIVHLGAYPNPADFMSTLLGPNVIGLHNVCEAAKAVDVARLVLASSIQVISGHDFPARAISVADGARPTNHYALTKVWAESAGEMCVESPTPARGDSAILFAASKPRHTQRLDLESARQIIGYEPQDVWPGGLPYAVDGL